MYHFARRGQRSEQNALWSCFFLFFFHFATIIKRYCPSCTSGRKVAARHFCRRWERCGNSALNSYAGISRTPLPDASWLSGALGASPGALDAVTMATAWPCSPGQLRSIKVEPELLSPYLPNSRLSVASFCSSESW